MESVEKECVFKPVAFVRNRRSEISDDYWGSVISEIELHPSVPDEAFWGIDGFSHLEILFWFDRVRQGVYSGHPRGNLQWPRMGIFAQRKKDRPNPIGLTTVELLAHRGRVLSVRGLDALDGTPVLDIKPVFREFAPRSEVRQPEWVAELMRDYWK